VVEQEERERKRKSDGEGSQEMKKRIKPKGRSVLPCNVPSRVKGIKRKKRKREREGAM